MAAQRLKLSFQPGAMGISGSIQGSLNGHRVAVTTFNKGSGKSSSTYTRYRMDYRHSVPVDLMIRRQGMFQELGKTFGMQDIETGNPGFDDIALVQGSDPDKVLRLLSPALQSAISDLAVGFSDVRITGSHVEIIRSGRDGDADVMVHTVRRLAGFCEGMMEAYQRMEVIQDPAKYMDRMEDPEDIEIEPPELSFNPLSTPHPVVPDPPCIPVTSTENEAVEEEMLELPPEYIADQQEVDEHTAADEVSLAEVELTVDPETVQDETRAAPESIDIEEAARELFGDSGDSLRVAKTFDSRFLNRSVTGSGELLRVGKFSYDPVFINERGVKVTLQICTLAGTYSTMNVTAEVMYPLDQYDQLEARIGESLPFTGICVGQDAMMHRLYIKTG